MERANLDVLWVYLSTSPLAGLTLTLVVYLFAYRLQKKTRSHPLVNTVLISVVLIVLILQLTNTSYQDYFDGAQFIQTIRDARWLRCKRIAPTTNSIIQISPDVSTDEGPIGV